MCWINTNEARSLLSRGQQVRERDRRFNKKLKQHRLHKRGSGKFPGAAEEAI